MKDTVQIYVALLDEGVDVWRPIDAILVRDDVYQLSDSLSIPEGEHWQFAPGTLVRCKPKAFSAGIVGLVACEAV